MPEQIPSAILDGSNSFDSLFALELDTKQRFDNAISGIQKPIDYPIPDFEKEFNPNGLSQHDLLNPSKTAGTLGEALFSTDPKISAYATDRLRQVNNRLPISQGVGVPDRFAYSKEIDKYLNGDWGYNPYASIEDNEDFNYRYDYMNQGLFERIFKNVGVGLSRFVGSVALKLGQSFGYLGSMIGNGVQEIAEGFGGDENNFMSDVADNSLSRWFEGVEEDMKNSNLLSVFKPKGWEDKGFFAKMGNGAFWTDEVADGAAFMGEMVASMYLMGNLGKIGWVGRLGETEINLAKGFAGAGKFGKYTGKTLDTIIKTGTGSQNLSDVGRWAFSVASESAFEASGLYHQSMDELKGRRTRGEVGYVDMSDEEMRAISGDKAAASYKGNMLILGASNAFENRFIFGPLFKKVKGVPDNVSPSAARAGRLSAISESTDSIDDIAKMTRKDYKYSTWAGKKIDWKNPNSRLRFYGSKALGATAAEGFWEENGQLAVERLASTDSLTWTSFASKLGDQTWDVLRSWSGGEIRDPEAETNVGLGALIGIGGTSIVSKTAAGRSQQTVRDPNNPNEVLKNADGTPVKVKIPFMQRGERRDIERDVQTVIDVYEKYRRGFLNYQDIYVRDPKTGKPILHTYDHETGKSVPNENGSLEIDDAKAAGILDGTAKFLSKQLAADKAADPLYRKELQDNAMMDYVMAAKMAGVYDRASAKFANLKNLDADSLRNLGFDPNTTVDSTYLYDSLKEFGKVFEETQKSPANLKKGETLADDEKRKAYLFKMKAGVYSATKILGEYQSKMMDKDFPSVFSPEAIVNSAEVQQYNSLIIQYNSLRDFEEVAKEHGSFYNDFIKLEKKRIATEMKSIEEILDSMMQTGALDLEMGEDGFLYSSKYDVFKPTAKEVLDEFNAPTGKEKSIATIKNNAKKRQTDIPYDRELDAQRKHAEYVNVRNQRQYAATKFANPNDGIKNNKEYLAFHESIHKKDAKVDNAAVPAQPADQTQTGTAVPPAGAAANAGLAAPVNPAAGKPKPTQKQVITAQEAMVAMKQQLGMAKAIFEADGVADYTEILKVLAENQDKLTQLNDVILDLLKVHGQVIENEVKTGVFKIDGIANSEFEVTAAFIDELLKADTAGHIEDLIGDYITYIETIRNEYKEPVTELNDAEQNAIATLNKTDYETKFGPTFMSKNLAIIKSDTSSNKDKQTALRAISDQLLASDTAQATEELLGREATDAIYDLNYPAPVKVDLSTTEGAAVNPKVKEAALAAAKADIEARREEEHKKWNYDRSKPNPVDIKFDAELAALESTPEKTYEQVGAYFISEEPSGRWGVYNDKKESLGLNYATKDEAIGAAFQQVSKEEQEALGIEYHAGDKVRVNTKKDGDAVIKEIRGDKALLEDGRQVLLANLIPVAPSQEEIDITAMEEERKALEEQAAALELLLEEAEKQRKVKEETQKVVEENLTEDEKKEGENVVEQVTTGVMEDMDAGKEVKKPSWLRRLINKIKKILLGLFALGTIYTGITGFGRTSDGNLEFRISNTIDKTLTVMPQTQQEWAKRFLEKQGIYESKDYTVEIVEDIEQTPEPEVVEEKSNKIEPKVEVLASVPDSYNPKDSLLVYRSTWNNVDGFEYVPGPNNAQGAGVSVPGVIGVGHFLLDASLYGGQQYSIDANQGFLAIAKVNNDYVPAFTRLANGNIRVKYKRYSAIETGDIVITPLRQFKSSDINWMSQGTPTGFKSNIKELKTKDGKGTYLIFKDRQGYSRFSGGSVVFIFDYLGNQVVIDFAGSLDMIERENNRIIREYNLSPENLIIGYHDVGSFSAKPKAKDGVIYSTQYSGYNNAGFTGGSLLIPMPEPEAPKQGKDDPKPPVTIVTLSVLLAAIRKKQAAGEPLTDEEIKQLKELLDAIKDKSNELNKKIGEQRSRLTAAERRMAAQASEVQMQPQSTGVKPPPVVENTQAEKASQNTEGSGKAARKEPPKRPPSIPVSTGSRYEFSSNENKVDTRVNEAKKNGLFTFVQYSPREIEMTGKEPTIVENVLQLRTLSNPQLLRQHNIMKKMGEKSNPDNFFLTDNNDVPLYKVKIEFAGPFNAAKYSPWVFAEKTDNFGKPTKFPYAVAMVVDQKGNYVNFDNEGNVVSKSQGMPFGFPYSVDDYYSNNLKLSRAGAQANTGEPLDGGHGFSNEDPLKDLNTALHAGIPIFGTIDEVLAGKLSTFGVDNTLHNFNKPTIQRSVAQMIEDGDLDDNDPFVLETGSLGLFEYASEGAQGVPGAQTQLVKVGQPHIVDSKTGNKIPLRGKKIKDLTWQGKPFITEGLLEVIEALDNKVGPNKNSFSLPDGAPNEAYVLLKNTFDVLRRLIYSQNTPIYLSDDGSTIKMNDKRTENIKLMETEINYDSGVTLFNDPFEETEPFSYKEFVRENFLSGAVQAQVSKGQKSFEKLNRRIIFTLDMNHKALLNAIGSKPSTTKTVVLKMNDLNKFVNKTFKRKGGEATITITGVNGDKLIITGEGGTVEKTMDQFLKDLRNLEEVKLPPPTEEVQKDFEDNTPFSDAKEKELNEKAKNMTNEDIDNLDFNDC